MAMPIDVISAIEYLISDKSKYITGINLTVDGGWTL
jgi:NAD(P)-dependent dehydrogenase (short-subunit alcohol dehydrogenase family)